MSHCLFTRYRMLLKQFSPDYGGLGRKGSRTIIFNVFLDFRNDLLSEADDLLYYSPSTRYDQSVTSLPVLALSRTASITLKTSLAAVAVTGTSSSLPLATASPNLL